MRSLSPLRSTSQAAWIALGLLSGLNLLNYLDRYVMSAVITPLQNELHLDDSQGGNLASAFMLGYFVSAPLFGYLGDRFARKFLMLSGVLVWSLATFASGLVHDYAQLLAVRACVGVGEACFVTIGPSWISDVFVSTRRNTALTLFYVATSVGSAIGFTIGGWFAGRGEWREAFLWVGAPGIFLALTLLFLREPERGEADGIHLRQKPKTTVWEVFGLLLNRRYNLLVWGYAAQTFAIGGFGFWGPTFLHRMHAMELSDASTIFGIMLAGCGLVATLLGGFVGNALRKRMPAGYVWIMAGSMLAAVPVSFVALTAVNTTLSLVMMGASMFFLFMPAGPISSEIFEIVPVHLRASAMALCVFVIHLFGDFTSPTLVGKISDLTDSLGKGVLVLPAVLILGAVLWCTLIAFTREPAEVEA